MKKPIAGSKRSSNQNQSTSSDQPKTPKWRPVFGEKYPPGFKPPVQEEDQTLENESTVPKSPAWLPNRNKKQTSSPNAKSAAKMTAVPLTKLKSDAWPGYFAKMDPVERILFAYTAYLQPKDESIDQFYSYNSSSFRSLDKDLPGLSYQEVIKLLTKWSKVGLLVEGGRYSNTYSLREEAAETFWQYLNQQVNLELYEVEPEKSFSADLPGTLDNLFNLLVLIEHGEVQVTRTDEINKHSLKRVLAALTEPARPENFTTESYFFWLLSIARFFELYKLNGDRLALTFLGRELLEKIKVENLLGEVCPVHVRSIPNKGFFLLLPVLSQCTQWTSWGRLVSQLISEEDVCKLLLQNRVIGLLDPLRFLGLLDWGKYEQDILVRVTPLGQLLLTKLLKGRELEDSAAEIKNLTDQIYPLSGPDTAYVQPNFEILLPRSASWTARWELSQFALLEQQDQMLKYRLDKNGLLSALKRGLPADEVLSVLNNLSPYPLPENLVLTVQQWIESFGQVVFLQLSLLECASPEQAASIVSSRKYREYVLGLYSPTAIIVREVEKLRKLLEKQGIYPLPGVLDGVGAAKRRALDNER